MKRIKVLIVDDSALIRQVFREVLEEEPDITVLDTACDPLDAREKIKRLNPDVITLDIEMPRMDGISFLEKIMALRPMPVIMASSLTQKGAEASLHALEIGAFDTVAKPVHGQNQDTLRLLKDELVRKVRAAAQASIRAGGNTMTQPGIIPFHPHANSAQLIAIGSSTGGVEALREIFLRLPDNAPPIVIAQHMPEHFTRSFAARMDGISRVTVKEATHHERLKQGHAYIAPGNMHLRIVRRQNELVCKLDDGPLVSGHRPSVDVLFASVADAAGAHAIGVILTGMGKDGASGLRHMRDQGAYTIGQNKQSCVVYGMPQMAMRAGAVCMEFPLEDIAAQILRHSETIREAV